MMLILCAIACPLDAVANDDGLIHTNLHGKVIVGSEIDYPPYALVDSEGNADGFSVDVIKAVAKTLNIEIEFKVGPWNQVKGMLERGEIDMLPLVAYSTERAKKFDFSSPYIISHAVAFIRKGSSDISSIEGLRGKEVIAMRSDSTHDLIRNSGITDKITLTNTMGDALKLLASGSHDFVIAPKLTGLMLLKDLGIDNVVSFGPNLEAYGKGYAFAVKNGDSDLLEHLNNGLALIKASGEFDRIYNKWFGHIDPKPLISEGLKKALMVAGSLIAILLLLFLFWNVSLRKTVSERTKELDYEKRMAQKYLQVLKALVVVLDREGIVTLANNNMCKALGWENKEIVGENWFENFLPVDAREASREAFLSLMDQQAPPVEFFENNILHRDGTERLVAWHNTIVEDDDGNIIGTLSSGEDVTDIRKSEAKMKVLEESFYQAQKMEALGTLVGGIAHDFNNMLAGMTGNLYLIKKKIKENPELVEKVNRVEQLAYRAAEMIQQLLTFARKGHIEMRPLPLTSFLKETLKLLRTSIPENITLDYKVSSELLFINGDATQLHQAVMNLVSNARDALENSSKPCIIVKLERFEADSRFIVKHPYFTKGPYGHLSVEDNGEGIPEENIEHLFDPFFTTKEQGKGTGLGLAMVFGAIKSHNGYIEVKSNIDAGTCFHIYLPLLHESDVSLPPSVEESTILKGNGEIILLVDDDVHILESGRQVLESLGYQVLEASNGLEAIDMFYDNLDKISLIIMDVVMPELGGVESVHRIREDHPDVKVIFSTGYDKEGALPAELLSDKVSVLSKPYNINEIASAIRDHLDS